MEGSFKIPGNMFKHSLEPNICNGDRTLTISIYREKNI